MLIFLESVQLIKYTSKPGCSPCTHEKQPKTLHVAEDSCSLPFRVASLAKNLNPFSSLPVMKARFAQQESLEDPIPVDRSSPFLFCATGYFYIVSTGPKC